MEIYENQTFDMLNTSGENNIPRNNQTMMVTQLLNDFLNIFLSSCNFVIASCSVLFNYFVLRALAQIPKKELKSKLLLANALVIDILFPLSYTMSTVLYIATALGLPANYTRACIDGTVALVSPTLQYAQSLSSLLLVCDRMYAVVAPLRYHITAYPRSVSVLILFSLWLLSAGSLVPVLIVADEFANGTGLCFGIAMAHKTWTNMVRFPILICASVLVFCIYGILFLVVRWRRRPKTAKTQSLKESISLTLTFFAVHASCLFLYVPGPLFASLVRSGNVPLDDVTMWQIRRLFILLYLLNSVVDPVIMSTRIPAIKSRLQREFGNGHRLGSKVPRFT